MEFAQTIENAPDLDVVKLNKWVIPKNSKLGIIDELERLGINHRTMFPDLDGISKGLWRSVFLRHAPRN